MTTVLELLTRFQSSAPVDVEGLIKSLGIALEKGELDPEISGQVEPTPDGSFKITVNKADHYFRRRFTMAHELGHVLLHSTIIRTGVNDSPAYRSLPQGRFFNPMITPAHEAQANQFAANLLMPRDLVTQEWERFRPELKKMAAAFQVSPAALRIRLEGLGLVPVASAATV